MRKRLIKNRKRIKSSTVGSKAKKGKTAGAGENKKRNAMGTSVGGALTLYERGDVERSAYDVADEEINDDSCNTSQHISEDAEHVSVGKREDILRLVCGFVVIFSLFSAVVLTCFAFAVATEYSEDAPAEDAFADNGVSDIESEKIIFIHTDEKGAGLTAPEIYEKCVKTAVSVSVSFADGGGEGIGSGFIISEDGYIATACHVVNGAESVRVILHNRKEYEASVVSSDSISDIALLKIEADGKLPAAEFGASSALVAGERVYAIGTPAALDYAGSLSSGEVSCPQRTLSVYRDGVKTIEKRVNVIQINAEVNKGNSGCPLFDTSGRVVGMVTMRLGENYHGIGFALPSEGVGPVLQAMREGRALNSTILSGVVELPARLGITCHTDEEGGAYGCRIDSVVSAAGALRVGDLVVQIDNKLVSKPSDISGVIEKKTAGERVRVTLIRSGQRLTFDIILGN